MKPNIDQFDRDQLEDLGLIDDDNTEEMRKAPGATDALRNESPRSHQPQKEIR